MRALHAPRRSGSELTESLTSGGRSIRRLRAPRTALQRFRCVCVGGGGVGGAGEMTFCAVLKHPPAQLPMLGNACDVQTVVAEQREDLLVGIKICQAGYACRCVG